MSCCDSIYEKYFKNERKSDLTTEQHLLIIYLMQGIYDLYSINPSTTTDVRMFLVKKSGITGKVLIPYITNSVKFAPALTCIYKYN